MSPHSESIEPKARKNASQTNSPKWIDEPLALTKFENNFNVGYFDNETVGIEEPEPL